MRGYECATLSGGAYLAVWRVAVARCESRTLIGYRLDAVDIMTRYIDTVRVSAP